MLSIHLSVRAQNVTGAYVIIMFVYRRLLKLHLATWQSSCVIANNQGYNLEVHNIIKYAVIYYLPDYL